VQFGPEHTEDLAASPVLGKRLLDQVVAASLDDEQGDVPLSAGTSCAAGSRTSVRRRAVAGFRR
jgi:hypothetical protein